jgi:hypothetical protein
MLSLLTFLATKGAVRVGQGWGQRLCKGAVRVGQNREDQPPLGLPLGGSKWSFFVPVLSQSCTSLRVCELLADRPQDCRFGGSFPITAGDSLGVVEEDPARAVGRLNGERDRRDRAALEPRRAWPRSRAGHVVRPRRRQGTAQSRPCRVRRGARRSARPRARRSRRPPRAKQQPSQQDFHARNSSRAGALRASW